MGRSSSRTPRGRRPAAPELVLFTGILLSLLATHFAGDRSAPPYRFALNGIALASTLIAGVGAWRQRAGLGIIGFWVFLALTLSTVAGIGVTVNVLWVHSEAYPNWTDAVYLSVYAVLVLTTLSIIRRRRLGRNLPALIDAAILTVGVGVLTYSFVIVGLTTQPGVSLSARLVGVLYPVCDVLVLGIVAQLLFGASAARAPLLLLTGGIMMLLAGDIGYFLAVYEGQGEAYAGWIDGLYLVYDVMLAMSLWQPGTPRIVEVHRGPAPRLGGIRISVLAFGALLAPVTVLIQNLQGNRMTVRAAAIGSIVLFVLTLIRMTLLIRAVESQSAQLEVLARTDGLTGLANRRTFDFELGRAMREALDALGELGTLGTAEKLSTGPGAGERPGLPSALSIGLLDLDHFKAYNDTYGHSQGDQLLRECAAHWGHVLEEAAPTARMARYGGEEFVVVFRGLDTPAAVIVMEAMLAATPHQQTFSAGVATWRPAEPALDLLNRADERLYAAKHAGRRRVLAEAPVGA